MKILILKSVVTHIIERPCVLNQENGYPLRLVIMDEHKNAEDARERIEDKKGNIEVLLMPRRLFVVGNVEQPIFYSHVRKGVTSLRLKCKTHQHDR